MSFCIHGVPAREHLASREKNGERTHLSNSQPSLLMIGNNYLKQLAFGARANSPAPICRFWNAVRPQCHRRGFSVLLHFVYNFIVNK